MGRPKKIKAVKAENKEPLALAVEEVKPVKEPKADKEPKPAKKKLVVQSAFIHGRKVIAKGTELSEEFLKENPHCKKFVG